MKTPNAALVLLFGSLLGARAQVPTTATAQANVPTPTDYQVVQQDGNSRVWQRETYEARPNGEVVTHLHQYTELTTGLNHLVNSQWLPSQEDIGIQPDGTAAATNGQHQAYFPIDIFNGNIEMVTPDGTRLKSQPTALSYDDGVHTVLIAVLTNSVGQLLGNNQVIYTNAFTGLNADLLYTYTKGCFEQDVVLQEQPPAPESLGLNPATTRLQVLTEFFNPPQPVRKTTVLPKQGGLVLNDESLDFGAMQMVPGKAFMFGEQSPLASVGKSWVSLQGRQFLLEELPLASLTNELGNLPPSSGQTVSRHRNYAFSRNRILPPPHLAKAGATLMRITRNTIPVHGLVLDYLTLNGSLANYVFLGNTTYFISGTLNLTGTNNIFEGGTVIKYTNSTASKISVSGGIVCNTGPYHPAIFTSMNDNSVGSAITGSTGTPTTNSATYLDVNSDSIGYLHDLRCSFAGVGIGCYAANETIWNSQFVNCNYGTAATFDNVSFYNVLFAGCELGLETAYVGTVIAENVTSDGNFASSSSISTLDITNCIVTEGAYGATLNANNNYTEYNTENPGFNVLSFYPPFQTAVAGNYYLTNGINCRGGGTTNINPKLLAELATKTTYPPLILSNQMVYASTTFSPQAQRDNDIPDVGYHYDPIDYSVDLFAVTNGTLTINSGTVVGFDNSAGIWLQDGTSISSVGTATSPNWFVHYTCAQEQPVLIGTNVNSGFYSSLLIESARYSNPVLNGLFQFTKFAIPAGAAGYYFYDDSTWTLQNLVLQNCELMNNGNIFDGDFAGFNASALLQNNLFNGSTLSGVSGTSVNFNLSVSNNLFFNTTFQIIPGNSSNVWSCFNNDFDTSTVICGTTRTKQNTTNGYNAYLNCTGYLNPTNATDIFSSSSLAYQTSYFGTFYQPTGNPLINKGSTTADLTGLYHFTVLVNQVPETNSIVDIGYHYVATDTHGNPLDANGDGIPDYLEDVNGDGIFGAGDLGDWQISPYGLSGANVLQVFTPLK